MMEVKEDLTGKIFGRWKVLEQAEDYVISSGRHYPQWLCECLCKDHTRRVVRDNTLKNGYSQSCGCLQKEISKKYFKKYNEYSELLKDENGEYYKVKLTNADDYFLIDADDWENAKQYGWSLTIYPKSGYKVVRAHINKKTVLLTAFIGCQYYDHIDRNSLNNRKYNLRPATQQQNTMNKSKGKRNKSGYIGVYWDSRMNKWCATIKKDYKSIYLGSFNNIEDAVNARKAAEEKYFGDFAPQSNVV